jgi:hypothetical protein
MNITTDFRTFEAESLAPLPWKWDTRVGGGEKGYQSGGGKGATGAVTLWAI